MAQISICVLIQRRKISLCEIYDRILQEGEARGRAEGILITLIELGKDGILTLAEAAKRANMTVAEFQNKSGLQAENSTFQQ